MTHLGYTHMGQSVSEQYVVGKAMVIAKRPESVMDILNRSEGAVQALNGWGDVGMRAVHRPWGRYQVVDKGDTFQVKRITVAPGARLSYQRHEHRSEHWVIVAGQADVTLDGILHRAIPGDTVHVPVRQAHRISNAGDIELVLVEVQLGAYLGEDDIERLQDDYGRTGMDEAEPVGIVRVASSREL